MQSQQFYVHYVLVKKSSLKPFLNFDNESAKISTKLLRKYKSDKNYYNVRRNVKDITKIYLLIMELLKLSNYQIKYAIATILCSLRTS